VAARQREQRRRLQLDDFGGGLRPGRCGPRVVEKVGRDRSHRPRARGDQRPGQPRVGLEALLRAERRAGPVGAEHGLGRHELAEPDAGHHRAAGTDPDQGLGSQADQLLDHDRRARAAHARRLHRERRAVARAAGVAPESPCVVEHQRLGEDRLRDGECAMGVARQQHPIRELGGGAQVDRLPAAHGRAD
jgi:hypothetical protein